MVVTARRAARNLVVASTLLKKLRERKAVNLTRKEFDNLIHGASSSISSSAAKEAMTYLPPNMPPSTSNYNALLRALLREGRHTKVLRTLAEIDMDATATSFRIGLTSCGRTGNVHEARRLLAIMHERDLQPTAAVYAGAILSCARTANVAQAQAFWQAMQDDGVAPTVDVFTSMLAVYGADPATYSLMRPLVSEAIRFHGIYPTRDMALHLAHVLPVADLVPWLAHLHARQFNVAQDGAIYRATLVRLDGEVSAVLHVLELYLNARPTISAADIHPFLCNLGLSRASTEAVVMRAWDKFHGIGRAYMPLYRTFLSMLADTDALPALLDLLGRMARERVVDPQCFRIALASAHALDRPAEMAQVTALLESTDIAGATVATYNQAMYRCAMRGDMAVAERFLECMPVLPNATSYGILLEGYAKQPPSPETHVRAMQLFRAVQDDGLELFPIGIFHLVKTAAGDPHAVLPLVKHLVGRRRGSSVTPSVFHCAACILRDWRMPREAIELCRIMADDAGIPPTDEMHQHVLLACARADATEDAMRFLQQHIQTPSIGVFNAAIKVCARAHKKSRRRHADKSHPVYEARMLFEGLQDMGLVPTVTTYRCLVDVLAQYGHFDDARALLREMQVTHGLPLDLHLYHLLLRGCMWNNRQDVAFDILAELEAKWIAPQVDTYNHILATMVRSDAHGPDDMTTLMADMDAQGLAPTVEAFTMLMQKCMRLRRLDEAIDVFDRMIELGTFPDLVCFEMYVEVWLRRLQPRDNDGIERNVPSASEDDDGGGVPDVQVVVQYLQDPRYEVHLRDADLYACVMHLFQKLLDYHGVNKWEDARAFLEQFDALSLHSVEANAVVMRLCNEAGQRAVVTALFNAMKDCGMQPSIECYVEYMVAVEASERWTESTNTLVELRRQFPHIMSEHLLQRTYMGRRYLEMKAPPA
ncbi:Aste57867_13800 [Aphanomyces stellatus]|uniref:Aste57867_13800 protein n=1 Tax=Aphanomyces stellatus TaxID=120398 RepID=A0A485L180_9STRA|nr:hypothetical protein As57867_013750 [Aphanomyces stellatus]VFT90632.1 Aste57867_13800 [Aphanomyces stellatus]